MRGLSEDEAQYLARATIPLGERPPEWRFPSERSRGLELHVLRMKLSARGLVRPGEVREDTKDSVNTVYFSDITPLGRTALACHHAVTAEKVAV
jgi:hypothetical protein